MTRRLRRLEPLDPEAVHRNALASQGYEDAAGTIAERTRAGERLAPQL